MILQNGYNLNWLQPFLNIFCGQCLEALATALDGDFSNSPSPPQRGNVEGTPITSAGVGKKK